MLVTATIREVVSIQGRRPLYVLRHVTKHRCVYLTAKWKPNCNVYSAGMSEREEELPRVDVCGRAWVHPINRIRTSRKEHSHKFHKGYLTGIHVRLYPKRSITISLIPHIEIRLSLTSRPLNRSRLRSNERKTSKLLFQLQFL